MQDRLARLVLTDPAEDSFEDPQILPPMFLGNDAGVSHCMTGVDFQHRVLRHEVLVFPGQLSFQYWAVLLAKRLPTRTGTTAGCKPVDALWPPIISLKGSSPRRCSGHKTH